MAPMAASTIKAQMRPYSTAVAPRCEPHSPLHRLIIGKPHFCAFSQVTIRANSLNKYLASNISKSDACGFESGKTTLGSMRVTANRENRISPRSEKRRVGKEGV